MANHAPTTLCTGQTSALVIDGANTICDRSGSWTALVASIVLMFAAVAVWRANARLRNRIFAGAALLSLPGLYALGVRRGDAPLHVAATAARLARIERSLGDDADAQGCVTRVPLACEACQPIARFAQADRVLCPEPVAPAEVAAPAPLRCDDEDLRCVPP